MRSSHVYVRSDQRVMGVEHVENLADLACRTALSYRGVAHITFPTDLQDEEASRKHASKRNLPHHTSDVHARSVRMAAQPDLQRAAEILNARGKDYDFGRTRRASRRRSAGGDR